MKFRTDFVTNSSSSSFILSFNDKADIQSFKNYCNEFCYNDFYDLIVDLTSDVLYIENYGVCPIKIRPIIEKLMTYNFPNNVKTQLQKLYNEDYSLNNEGNDTIKIRLNNILEDDTFDVASLNFENILIDDCEAYIQMHNDNRSIKIALEELDRAYTSEFTQDYVDGKISHTKYSNFGDYLCERDEILNSEEYQTALTEHLLGTDYFEKKKRIEESRLSIHGTIWDSYGGTLEWSIRNGFIENAFHKNCINVFYVG